jgi:hypothetical protein
MHLVADRGCRAAAAFRMILVPIDTLKTTLQTQGAFMGCIYGVHLWGAFMGCIYGVHLWGAFMGFMPFRHPARLFSLYATGTFTK